MRIANGVIWALFFVWIALGHLSDVMRVIINGLVCLAIGYGIDRLIVRRASRPA